MAPEANREAEHVSSALAQQILMSTKADTIDNKIEKIFKTDEEWKEQLTRPNSILRNQGMEVPFVNEYRDHKEEGIYYCKACGLPLFHSKTKYKSGTGWPSFWTPICNQVVEEREDNSYFIIWHKRFQYGSRIFPMVKKLTWRELPTGTSYKNY